MFGLLRRCTRLGLLVVLLGLAVPGCDSGSNGGGDGTSNGGSQNDGKTQLAVNDDPNSDLVAQAKVSDGSSFSVFGEKSGDGDVEQVSQIDVTLEDGESLTLELDDDERPVLVEGGDSTTTFSYDDDTATVQAEVDDSSGTAILDGDVSSNQTSAKVAGRRFRATPESLCERLRNAQGVLGNLFECSSDDSASDDDSKCRGKAPQVLNVIDRFCSAQAEVVDQVDANLSDEPKEIPLGVKGFFTTRPRDGGATVVLVATVFGGVKPIERVAWELTNGPEAPVENLPGGVAVGDIGPEGSHTFKVTATDSQGNTATHELEVGESLRPVINVVADPPVATPGEEVTFTIESNVELPADVLDNVKWRFGDGNESVGAGVTHTYDEGGAFVVMALLRGDNRRETASTVVRVGDDLECWEGCQTDAEQVFFECDFNNAGDANCAARSNAVLAQCLAERCSEELDCDFHCHRFGAKVRRQCMVSGGNRRLCAAAGRAARFYCTFEQCDEQADCDQFCEDDFDLFVDECLESEDRGADCEVVADDSIDQCIVEECGAGFECEDECAEQSDRLFDSCNESGASFEECAARSRRWFEDCVHEQCDGDFDCAGVCEEQRDQIIRECEADGVDPQICRQDARDFVDFCLFENCGVEGDFDPLGDDIDPIDPNDLGGGSLEECKELCRLDAEDARKLCRESGGTSGECGPLGDFILRDCVENFCEGGDPTGSDPFGDDPFGDGGFGDDPFGDDPFGDDPFADDPFGGDPFADPFGGDPFGDDPTGAGAP